MGQEQADGVNAWRLVRKQNVFLSGNFLVLYFDVATGMPSGIRPTVSSSTSGDQQAAVLACLLKAKRFSADTVSGSRSEK